MKRTSAKEGKKSTFELRRGTKTLEFIDRIIYDNWWQFKILPQIILQIFQMMSNLNWVDFHQLLTFSFTTNKSDPSETHEESRREKEKQKRNPIKLSQARWNLFEKVNNLVASYHFPFKININSISVFFDYFSFHSVQNHE